MIFLSFFSCTYNKKEQNDTIIKTSEFNNKLYINIFGSYAHGVRYDYTVKTIESKHILLVSHGFDGEKYGRLLSDNEMNNIYNFIKEHEIENEIKKVTEWSSSGDFYGFFILNIDDKEHEYRIIDRQETENNFYTVLNYLNDYIEDNKYYMPIMGIEKGND
jgi:hypothetical protein